jgi:hypothetical protein
MTSAVTETSTRVLDLATAGGAQYEPLSELPGAPAGSRR